jgi:hypothetical protein
MRLRNAVRVASFDAAAFFLVVAGVTIFGTPYY